MALTIGSNLFALAAQKGLNQTLSRLQRANERLSTGLRINRAADDVGGSAIASEFTSDLKSLDVAQSNNNQAISMLQTAEGALKEIDSLLQQMREKANQAGTSGTLSTAERVNLDTEFESLKSEVNRLTVYTEYNDTVLVDGSLGTVTFQVGYSNSAASRISVTFGDADATALSVNATDISTACNAQDSLTELDAAIASIASQRATLGATQNRLKSNASLLDNQEENITAARSTIQDADIAEETVELTRQQILMQVGASVLAQATQLPSIALKLLS